LSKIDYSKKAELLRSGLPQKVNQIEKSLYARTLLDSTGEILHTTLDYDTALRERCFLLEQDPDAYSECEKIIKARYKKASRVRSKLSQMLRNNDTVVFLTLTFSDETLRNTTEQTRRRYVTRFLGSFASDYVANIDFGKTNGREHYHAVANALAPHDSWSQYGFIFSEYVKDGKTDCKPRNVPKRYKDLPPDEQRRLMSNDDEKRLAKYIAKLSNHAIKETNRRSVLIYSKSKVKTPPPSNCDGYVYSDKKGTVIVLAPTDEILPF
jgi:hypothetical protein